MTDTPGVTTQAEQTAVAPGEPASTPAVTPVVTPVPSPRTGPAADGWDAREVIVARIAGDRYAVPMDLVAEVGRPPRLTRVPGVPAWVLGVANWRGRVLAVLDLAEMLGGATTAPDGPGRLLVLADGASRVGLLTDGVEGVARLDQAPEAPPALPARAAALVSGQVQDAHGVLALLSVIDVLALSSQLPRPRRAE